MVLWNDTLMLYVISLIFLRLWLIRIKFKVCIIGNLVIHWQKKTVSNAFPVMVGSLEISDLVIENLKALRCDISTCSTIHVAHSVCWLDQTYKTGCVLALNCDLRGECLFGEIVHMVPNCEKEEVLIFIRILIEWINWMNEWNECKRYSRHHTTGLAVIFQWKWTTCKSKIQTDCLNLHYCKVLYLWHTWASRLLVTISRG